MEDVHSKTKGNRNRKKLKLEICILSQREVTRVRNPGMNNLLLPDGQRTSNPSSVLIQSTDETNKMI